jgi:AraC-like DNA-binding protein
MALTSHIVASGPGWKVRDTVCTSGPHDRPFEERHDTVLIAAVTSGTFQYRNGYGRAIMTPGALVLGNAGACFVCGHEHATGDRCIAFNYEPALLESIVRDLPGARRLAFDVPRLPPLQSVMPLTAAAEAARDDADADALEELAIRLAAAVVATLSGSPPRPPLPSRRDERRVNGAVRSIEARAQERLTLTGLARESATSPYHFLRTFRQIVGMTPHQYVLRIRMHRAAVRLRRSDDPISTIAFDTGFSDLSTFNRRFRRLWGMSPSAWRAAARR